MHAVEVAKVNTRTISLCLSDRTGNRIVEGEYGFTRIVEITLEVICLISVVSVDEAVTRNERISDPVFLPALIKNNKACAVCAAERAIDFQKVLTVVKFEVFSRCPFKLDGAVISA